MESIVQYEALFVWFLAHSVMRDSSVLWQVSVFGRLDCGVWSVLWIFHCFFTHPSVEGHLGCFQGVHFHSLKSAKNKKSESGLGEAG